MGAKRADIIETDLLTAGYGRLPIQSCRRAGDGFADALTEFPILGCIILEGLSARKGPPGPKKGRGPAMGPQRFFGPATGGTGGPGFYQRDL